jgi:transcriptional regulator with XRE-family HTH domain
MKKKLNIPLIQTKLENLGLSQSKISKELSVSREAISQWLSGECFPRPDKLLKLGRVLSLKYSELVIQDELNEPIVAYRKVGNAVTKDRHITRAKEMGYALEHLVPYLPYETMTRPAALNQPKNEYKYIQEAVKAFREILDIQKIKVEVPEIINYFLFSKTILIPLLLGEKENHENALHIHLVKSATNWVFVNLDTNELDFKFWLVHELGHIIAPQLKNNEAEDFADNFAGAFLFPYEIASQVYKEAAEAKNPNKKYNVILDYARNFTIAAYTIIKEINKYAEESGLPEIEFDKTFYAINTKFAKNYPLVSSTIFNNKKPSAEEFIRITKKEYKTVFFDTLQKYVNNSSVSYSYLRSLLNLPVADSIELFNLLKNAV